MKAWQKPRQLRQPPQMQRWRNRKTAPIARPEMSVVHVVATATIVVTIVVKIAAKAAKLVANQRPVKARVRR